MEGDFDPDDSLLTSGEGAKRVHEFYERHGVKTDGILTSRDRGMEEAREELPGRDLPEGFKQFQLPVIVSDNVLAFQTSAEPGAKLPRHRHKDAHIMRVVISGSVIYEGKTLTPGDWMFVPAGQEYELEAGPEGFIVQHGYIPPKPPRP